MNRATFLFLLLIAAAGGRTAWADVLPPPPMVPGTNLTMPSPLSTAVAGVALSAAVVAVGLLLARKRGLVSRLAAGIIAALVIAISLAVYLNSSAAYAKFDDRVRNRRRALPPWEEAPPLPPSVQPEPVLANDLMPPVLAINEEKPLKSPAALLKLHNEERKKQDLPPLSLNAELTKAAQAYAEYLAESGEFSHTAQGIPPDRIKAAGYDGRAMGENIAKGQTSEAEVMQSWLDSKTHKENILREEFSEVGFGFAKNEEGDWLWVTNFGGR